MLACDIRESWIQFLEYVQVRCSRAAFENWLAPIKLVEASEGEVTLEVPNIFVQEYLLTNYKKELLMFLPADERGEPAVQFQIKAPNKEAIPLRKTSEPIVPKTSEVGRTSFYEVKLNSRYKFSNFIEGASNQFIKSAAMGVALRPGQSYNPLFIHGPVGLGKTHLLHSIGHHIQENHKGKRVQLITTEGFINDFVENLKRKTADKMKRFYRSDVDFLLMDDIQFLQNRLNFEEEFCVLIDHYVNNGKQVVLTCDKPPSQLKLSERMKARMEWGLVAHMTVPDLETRVAILKHKAEEKGLVIPSEVAFYIAEHLDSNVRQLEGAVNRLCAHSHLLNTPVTKDLVQATLGSLLQSKTTNSVTVEDILKSAATIFQVKVSDIKGAARTKSVALARQVAMYLAKALVNESLMSLGVFFNKTHSTILHACKTIEEKMKADERLGRQVEMVKRNLPQ